MYSLMIILQHAKINPFTEKKVWEFEQSHSNSLDAASAIFLKRTLLYFKNIGCDYSIMTMNCVYYKYITIYELLMLVCHYQKMAPAKSWHYLLTMLSYSNLIVDLAQFFRRKNSAAFKFSIKTNSKLCKNNSRARS